MKRRLSIAIALVLALAAIAPARTVEAHTVSRSSFRDWSVEAFFSSTDGSGCVVTNVFIFATKNRSYTSPGPAQRGASALLTITQADICTDTAFLLDGSTALSSWQLKISPDFSKATLNTTIPVCNTDLLNDCRNVTVNLTWRGSGRLAFRHNYFSEKLDGCTIFSHSFGLTRQAVASGYVSDGATNFTPTPSILIDTRIVLALDGQLTACA